MIAAINGYAMGGGLECALACDVRIAEEQAQMALPEAAVGLLPCGCGTQTLPWLVGEGWAKRMILTNERVDAATALRIGLVEEVVPRGKALDTALAMAERACAVSRAQRLTASSLCTWRARACSVRQRWRWSASALSTCSTAKTSAKASMPSCRSARRSGAMRRSASCK